MKNIRWSGSVMIGMVALAACGGGNQNAQQQQAPPPTPVTVTVVQEGASSYYDEFVGTATALNQVDIRPQVAGYITGIFFTDGQHVSKGQKLYSIDQQQYRGAYEQAVANLNVAKANLAKAQQDADRYQELAKNDAIAKQTLDHALADLEANKKQVEAAQANVSSVETNLRYSNIYAPFDGTVGISQVKLGAAVTPGSTLLNTISSDNPMAVDINVDEKQLGRFVALQREKAGANDSTFTLVLPDLSVYPYHGNVALIDRAIDQQTGTIRARLVFPNPKNELRPGMNVNVRVLNDAAKQQILIPAKAIVEQMGEFFVFVVGDSSKVSQRKLQLGVTVGDKRVVHSGLQSNEKIVVDGVQKLRDGAKVQIGEPGKPGAPGAAAGAGAPKAGN